MKYEKYKTIKSEREFWLTWEKDTLDNISEEDRDRIYKRYFMKCLVFQRDKFKCKNADCRSPQSKITFHHIKHQRNGGKDSLKNCITVCIACHKRFNKGGILELNGMKYKLHKQSNKFDWKQQKAKTKKIRRELKNIHGINISLELLKTLIRFLEKDYSDMWE